MFNAMLMRSRNKKGFTLMEMLIVVAIIAILVAVSFPVFNAQLESARNATDNANVRAAKAVAIATFLTATTTPADVTNHFDAENGKLVAVASSDLLGYGKSKKAVPGSSSVIPPEGKIIETKVSATGEFSFEWITETKAP